MTDTIRHHLTEPLLMGYAAGTLPEAFNLVVATHLSLCDTCRASAEAYEALGGSLVDDTAPADLDEGSLAATMARIRAADDMPDDLPAQPVGDAVLPAPLAGYVGGGLADVKWRSVGMGVRQAILPTAPGAIARLLHIPAGTAVPDHGHHGTEVTLVLKGAFQDQDGIFARGDVEVANEELDHMPVADISEDCICLAVTDAPLKFRGLIPRLAQPFLKI